MGTITKTAETFIILFFLKSKPLNHVPKLKSDTPCSKLGPNPVGYLDAAEVVAALEESEGWAIETIILDILENAKVY